MILGSIYTCTTTSIIREILKHINLIIIAQGCSSIYNKFRRKMEKTSIYLHHYFYFIRRLSLSVPRKLISLIVDRKERERERAKLSLFHNKIVVRLARGGPTMRPRGLGIRPSMQGCTTRGRWRKRRRGFSLSHGGEAGCVNRAHTKRTHAPRHCACLPPRRLKGAPPATKGCVPAHGFKTEFFIRSTGKRPS